MKKLVLLFAAAAIFSSSEAQGINGFIKKVTKKDSSGNTGIRKIIPGGSSTGLSTDEIASGLKEALSVGANNASQKLSTVDGFFKDAAIKILMPAEAQKVEK